MKRSYLIIGDKSAVGGIVIDGIPLVTHNGKELAFVGATVNCPACKDSGHIVAQGPRWPGDLMGKQVALEGDVCACKCYPLPAMLASQSDMTMSFESHELAAMGFAANGLSLTEKEASDHWIKFALDESGSCEGLHCRAYFADGSIERGIFDAENVVHFDRPNASPCRKVELIPDSETPAGSIMESLLFAMAGR